MRVLIDTSTFIWMLNRPARISREAARVLKKPKHRPWVWPFRKAFEALWRRAATRVDPQIG
jgi:PIN domain nuclease of toxin-antitoxin system